MGPPRRTEIKKIEDLSARQVTFSKRRKGLFKKAKNLSDSFGGEVAAIVFSETGKLYQFSTTSMEQTLSRYCNYKGEESSENRQRDQLPAAEPETQSATLLLQKQIASLKSDCSRMRGVELDGLSLKDLDELEKQLNQVIVSISKRKDEVVSEELHRSESQEERIMEMLRANNNFIAVDRSRLFYASSSNDISSCNGSEGSGRHQDLSLNLSLSLCGGTDEIEN